jgi:hypothetical protein
LILFLALSSRAFGMDKLFPEEARSAIKPETDYSVIIIAKELEGEAFTGKLRSFTQPVFGRDLKSARLDIISGFAVRVPSKNFATLLDCDEVEAIWIIPEAIFSGYVDTIRGIQYFLTNSQGGSPINISLGPPPSLLPLAYHADEPINRATKAAFDAGNLVIFSVGNAGPKSDTLNPWALAPWVVGVGAASKDGAVLWKQSSRGRAGDIRYRPTVVAPGMDILTTHPPKIPKTRDLIAAEKRVGFEKLVSAEKRSSYTIVTGTSFAAGHVTGAAMQLFFFLREAEKEATNSDGVKTFRIQYPGVVRAELGPNVADNRMIGVPDDDKDIFAVTYPARRDPLLVKQILIDAATPMKGFREFEVGSGFVDQDRIQRLFGKYGLAEKKIMPIKVTE